MDGRVPPKPSLSQYDISNFDDYEVMQSGSWDKGRGAVRRKASEDEPVPPTVGDAQTCWCGQPFGHSWPGRNEGAPHPR